MAVPKKGFNGAGGSGTLPGILQRDARNREVEVCLVFGLVNAGVLEQCRRKYFSHK